MPELTSVLGHQQRHDFLVLGLRPECNTNLETLRGQTIKSLHETRVGPQPQDAPASLLDAAELPLLERGNSFAKVHVEGGKEKYRTSVNPAGGAQKHVLQPATWVLTTWQWMC